MEGCFNWNSGTAIVSEADVVRYAVALIKAVEQEAEVVGYKVQCLDGLTILSLDKVKLVAHTSTPLIALPLIGE
jgi:hypothetical protein